MVSANFNFSEAKQPVIDIFHGSVKGSLFRQSVGSISSQSGGYYKRSVSRVNNVVVTLFVMKCIDV